MAGTNNFLVPNGTFFVVLIIFLIVLGVIGKWVVPPISKVLREREAMVAKTSRGQREVGRAVRRRPGRLPKAEMAKARGEASTIRDEARAEGRKVIEEMRAEPAARWRRRCSQADEQLKRAAATPSS